MQSQHHQQGPASSGQKTTHDFSVAIIGGGMCGLTLAIMLARSGIKVELFESHDSFGEVGASVTFGANAVRAFKEMGLLDTICNFTNQQPHCADMLISVDDGEKEVEIDTWADEEATSDLAVHRVSFLDALIPLFPPKHVHFNKRCKDVSFVESSGMYQVHFDDGTSFPADLVIGADGIHSAVRKVVVQGVAPFSDEKLHELSAGSRLKEDKNLMFTGARLYRALIPFETLQKDGLKTDVQRMKICLGPKGSLFMVPIRAGTVINVAAFSEVPPPIKGEHPPPLPLPWTVKGVTNDHILRDFPGWSEDFNIILRNVGTSSYWSLHSVGPYLDTFVRGRIALIGDAAHASTPFLGAGVGQGIEDCYMLWKLLSDPKVNKKNLESILKVYDEIRRPRAHHVVTSSNSVPNLYEKLADPKLSVEDKRKASREYRKLQEGIKKHPIETDVKKAHEMLKAEGCY